MVIESILLIITAYLLGSIPAAYLASHWLRGRDLRHYGSGTVSGSMVWEHVARWAVVPVGLFDIVKAAFPTWLGMQLGLGMPIAATAGMAATAGHNWSIYLRFLSCIMGTLLVIFPWGFPWVLSFVTVGWLLGDSAPWALISMFTLPLFVRFMDRPAVVTPVVGGILLTLTKRLEANGRSLPPPGLERQRVILYRLLLDRDIVSHTDWIQRRPDEE
jgi:glycerol-3-phosphate acyltransferase PlsY